MITPVLIAFAVIVAVAVTGLVLTVRLTVRTGGLSPSLATPTEVEAVGAETAPHQPRALPRKVGTPRGIRPPATPQLTTVQMSPECAEGMHALCPRSGGCECPCDHDSKRIVAWNKAEYDRTHGKVPA